METHRSGGDLEVGLQKKNDDNFKGCFCYGKKISIRKEENGSGKA